MTVDKLCGSVVTLNSRPGECRPCLWFRYLISVSTTTTPFMSCRQVVCCNISFVLRTCAREW